MKTNSMHAALATFLTLALLAGCGGDQNPASPGGGIQQGVPPAEQPFVCDAPPEEVISSLPPRVVGGTIVDQANGKFVLVTYKPWGGGEVEGRLFYGIDTAGPPKVAGIVTFGSPIRCNRNDKRAFNGTEYHFGTGREQAFYDRVDKVYVHVTMGSELAPVTGSIRALDGAQATRRLAGGPIPGSTFDASARPILEDIAGAWDLTDPAGTLSTITIANDGKLSGTFDQCVVDGVVEPSRDGTNVFAVRLKPAPDCAIEGSYDFRGFIVAIPLAAGGVQALFWAERREVAVNIDGLDWFYMLAVGQRPAR
jgi:hypothetical protein